MPTSPLPEILVPVVICALVMLATLAFAEALSTTGTAANRRRSRILGGRVSAPAEVSGEGVRRVDAWAGASRLARFFANSEVRDLLGQCGWRSRRALQVYLVAQVTVPVLFMGLALAGIEATGFVIDPVWLKISLLGTIGIVGALLPLIALRQRAQQRRRRIQRDWPDALDIVLLCVEAGMPVDQALKRVAAEMSTHAPLLSAELELTTAELSYLDDRARAYENLARRTGIDEVRAVTQALIQAERYGTSLGGILRSMSEEARTLRMTLAEKRAAALPPLMTVPLVLFFMPVLLLVIFAPGVIRMLSEGML